MVYNIFLSGWRDSCSDWGNGLPKNRGRIKKGAWISQPSKNLQQFLDSKRIREITTYSEIKRHTQSHSKKMKSKWRESVHSLSQLNVINLLGKKKLRTEAVKSASKVSGKCNICGTIFESREDKAFHKKNGMRKTTWVGCDKSQCTFWGHATCAVLLLIPHKPVIKHKFFCKDYC